MSITYENMTPPVGSQPLGPIPLPETVLTNAGGLAATNAFVNVVGFSNIATDSTSTAPGRLYVQVPGAYNIGLRFLHTHGTAADNTTSTIRVWQVSPLTGVFSNGDREYAGLYMGEWALTAGSLQAPTTSKLRSVARSTTVAAGLCWVDTIATTTSSLLQTSQVHGQPTGVADLAPELVLPVSGGGLVISANAGTATGVLILARGLNAP